MVACTHNPSSQEVTARGSGVHKVIHSQVNPKSARATWDHLLFIWKLNIGEGKRGYSRGERLARLLSCLNKVTWRYISDFLVHLFFLETDVFCLRHIMGTQQYIKQSPDLTGLTSQWGLSSAHPHNSSSHLPLRVGSVRWHKVKPAGTKERLWK